MYFYRLCTCISIYYVHVFLYIMYMYFYILCTCISIDYVHVFLYIMFMYFYICIGYARPLDRVRVYMYECLYLMYGSSSHLLFDLQYLIEL